MVYSWSSFLNQIIFQSLSRATYSSKICIFKLKGNLKDSFSSHMGGVIFIPLLIIALPLFEEMNSYLFKKENGSPQAELIAYYFWKNFKCWLPKSRWLLPLPRTSEIKKFFRALSQDISTRLLINPAAGLLPSNTTACTSLVLYLWCFLKLSKQICIKKKSWSLLEWHGFKLQDTGDYSIDKLF